MKEKMTDGYNLNKAHICYTCHAVRCCKGCCKACKAKCSCPHNCDRELMTVNEGWEWYHNVRLAIDCDDPLIKKNIPEHLRERVERMTKEPIQLHLEFL